MDREKFDKARGILEQIEELNKQVRFMELYDHCGLLFYPKSEIDEPKEKRFEIYLDSKSLKMIVENKKEEIKELEKQFSEL